MMNIKNLQILKKELSDILKKSHPGSINLKISDRIELLNADVYAVYRRDYLLAEFNLVFYGSIAYAYYKFDKSAEKINFSQSEIADNVLMESFQNFLDENEDVLLDITIQVNSYIEID